MSGGERARVLIARALAQDAPILMADEPVAGLDPAHQIALMEILAALAGGGRTVLVTLHELHLAAGWCHRLLLLDRGRIVADGEPASVLSEERIAQVYGVRAYRSQSQGRPVILPIERLNRPHPAPPSSGEA
jgi:iron complex transport system ATP-binding protein